MTSSDFCTIHGNRARDAQTTGEPQHWGRQRPSARFRRAGVVLKESDSPAHIGGQISAPQFLKGKGIQSILAFVIHLPTPERSKSQAELTTSNCGSTSSLSARLAHASKAGKRILILWSEQYR